MRKTTALALATAATVALLAGCGVRGALEAPQQAGGEPASTSAEADSGQGKKAGETPKPHKLFILDGLLK